jgi:hypothetical protein
VLERAQARPRADGPDRAHARGQVERTGHRLARLGEHVDEPE